MKIIFCSYWVSNSDSNELTFQQKKKTGGKTLAGGSERDIKRHGEREKVSEMKKDREKEKDTDRQKENREGQTETERKRDI